MLSARAVTIVCVIDLNSRHQLLQCRAAGSHSVAMAGFGLWLFIVMAIPIVGDGFWVVSPHDAYAAFAHSEPGDSDWWVCSAEHGVFQMRMCFRH